MIINTTAFIFEGNQRHSETLIMLILAEIKRCRIENREQP